MAIPSTPTGFFAQQANRQVYLSWDIVTASPALLNYNVQRSTDGVTFATIATPTLNNYLDTTALVGVQYYYQVAATNVSGTSPYTTAQIVIPTPTGEMSLGQIRLNAQQRADRVNSNFVTLPEWNQYINQSQYELYDLLITLYEDYYVLPPIQFSTNGSQYQYPLPDGVLTFLDLNGSPIVAQPFYKLNAVDLGINTANNAWVSVNKFNMMDRNQFVYPNSSSTIYGVFNLRYRVLGNIIDFIPTPSANQPIRLWYTPRLNQLLKDNDITSTSISGWIEYVIVDAAIKAMQKEESDVSVLMAQKMALKQRIEETAMNRDAGLPDTISNVRVNGYWGGGSGFGYSGANGGY